VRWQPAINLGEALTNLSPVVSAFFVGVGGVTDADPEQPQSMSGATTSKAEAEIA